jgi:hypothetical protein
VSEADYGEDNDLLEFKLTEEKKYKFDVSKIETIEDIKVILDALDIIIYDKLNKFDKIKKYLIIE